jgi:hypothetical protein
MLPPCSSWPLSSSPRSSIRSRACTAGAWPAAPVERRGFSPPGSCDGRARLRGSRKTLGGLKARRSTNHALRQAAAAS